VFISVSFDILEISLVGLQFAFRLQNITIPFLFLNLYITVLLPFHYLEN